MSYDPAILLETLVRHDVRFIVIGASAAWLQGNPAVTLDLDITPEQDIDNAERLATALTELRPRTAADMAVLSLDTRVFLGWQPQTFITDAGRIDVVPDVGGVGTYADLIGRAVHLRIDDHLEVVVASLDDVIASKEFLGRPKDRLHLETLYETRSALADGPTNDGLDGS